MIATARIVMPRAMVRLSAGRVRFSQPEQVNQLMSSVSTFHKFTLDFVKGVRWANQSAFVF